MAGASGHVHSAEERRARYDPNTIAELRAIVCEEIQEKEGGKNFMLNDDGYSVKGCTIIYAPKGQAGEYAKLATNPYSGCGHGCVYCYVPPVIHMTRFKFNEKADPKKDFLQRLRKDAEKYRQHGITEQVMLCFTTDPYNHDDVKYGLTRQCLTVLRDYGLGFCTLTKGGRRALRDIELFRPIRDAFASTLTTLDPDQSREWEPKAALPDDRLHTLKRFHSAGIFTWVILEPVYDTTMTIALIKETAEYVDFYKVGKINYHRISREIDWRRFTEDVLKALNDLGKKHYIKKDLQPFLPPGYSNRPHSQPPPNKRCW
jgi:DNA repair photolyase